MNGRRKLLSATMLLMAFLFIAPPSRADDAYTVSVRHTKLARISYLAGDVTIQHPGSDEWDSALINLPVAAGDLVYTGSGARVELQLYGANVRLNERTAFEAVELGDERYRFDLTAGTATFSIEKDHVDEIEIATPTASVMLKKSGVYRINVFDNGDAEILVRMGEAEALGQGGLFKLREGRRAFFRSSSPLDVELTPILAFDSWDDWNEERDRLAKSYIDDAKYLGGKSYGTSDLSRYGSWRNVPTYGWVWRPAGLAYGWAPYRYGRWVNNWGWGWTWVSYDPWGWLPYHYGYWVYLTNNGEWVWVPSGFDYWQPAPVNWYYYNWNGRNYVCWQPRPHPTQAAIPTAPKPLVSGTVGQPVGHDRGPTGREPVGTLTLPKPVDQPVGRDGGLKKAPGGEFIETFNGGLTALDESDFVGGAAPKTPERELLERLRGARPIDIGKISIKPTRSAADNKPSRELPSIEVIQKPVVTRSLKSEGKPASSAQGHPRREREVIVAPVVKVPTASDDLGDKKPRRQEPKVFEAPAQKPPKAKIEQPTAIEAPTERSPKAKNDQPATVAVPAEKPPKSKSDQNVGNSSSRESSPNSGPSVDRNQGRDARRNEGQEKHRDSNPAPKAAPQPDRIQPFRPSPEPVKPQPSEKPAGNPKKRGE